MRPSNYETNNKKIILDTIINIGNKFSAKDIYNILSKSDTNVGMTTIYREIDNLLKTEQIIKINTDDKTTFYQYKHKCEHKNCVLLNCTKCNKTYHIDCDTFSKFNNHIKKEHKFTIDNKNIVINGLCNNCMEGK